MQSMVQEVDSPLNRNRQDWVDQIKGLAIFLVVYAHNFPVTETYIYTFHMPLFFMVSGFFFPRHFGWDAVKKRFKTIIIPYFLWAFFLFLFWVVIGKKMGASSNMELSNWKNFIGIFYAQGESVYMDWGIPMWFLPCMFILFCMYGLLSRLPIIARICASILIVVMGMIYARYSDFRLPWSVDIACVALFFFFIGNIIYPYIKNLKTSYSFFLFIICFVVHWYFFPFNTKIDMYRAIYGNEFYFILNGLAGSFFVVFFFKALPYFKTLSVVGKYSIILLATQGLTIAFIKFILLYVFHRDNFDFSEWEKFVFAILQVAMMYPVYLIINKRFPILNGGHKKA